MKSLIGSLKNFLKRLAVILFHLLKPVGRVLWFIFEWPIKLAPILIIGGYSAALWEVDSAFLEQAKTARTDQNRIRTYRYLHANILPTDQKYVDITAQEGTARANMDRGKLVKAQFRFTLLALGHELGKLLAHPWEYPDGQFGTKMLAIYDHVQFMPAEGIEAIIDGNWYTELDFADDFKNLDHTENNYVRLATKKVDRSWQAGNQLFYFFNGHDYRHTAAGIKSQKTDDDESDENDNPPESDADPLDKTKQDQCRAKALNKVKEMEAELKKETPSLDHKDWSLDLEEYELNEYYQCLGHKPG